MKKIVLYVLVLLVFAACHHPRVIVSMSSKIHVIDSSLDEVADKGYMEYLAPIKADLEEQLNVKIGYAPEDLKVHQPECTMLNWATDALLAMARQYSPEPVDIAVVNIGGMRCNWGKGNITFKHVFELMPFDNELVVLTLSGQDLLELCQVFAKIGGEGAAGMRIKVSNGVVTEATINGEAIDPTKQYTVATSDYLSQGNDGMLPLAKYTHMWKSEQKIRDLYIEYIQQKGVVEAHIDGRFVVE